MRIAASIMLAIGLSILLVPGHAEEKPETVLESASKHLELEMRNQVLALYQTSFSDFVIALEDRAKTELGRRRAVELLSREFGDCVPHLVEYNLQLHELNVAGEANEDEGQADRKQQRQNIENRLEAWISFKRDDYRTHILGWEIARIRTANAQDPRLPKLDKELKALLDKLFQRRLQFMKEELEEMTSVKAEIEETARQAKEAKHVLIKQRVRFLSNVLDDEDDDNDDKEAVDPEELERLQEFWH